MSFAYVILSTVCFPTYSLGLGGGFYDVCIQTARISTSSVVQAGETAYPIRDLDTESREQRSNPHNGIKNIYITDPYFYRPKEELDEFRGRMQP